MELSPEHRNRRHGFVRAREPVFSGGFYPCHGGGSVVVFDLGIEMHGLALESGGLICVVLIAVIIPPLLVVCRRLALLFHVLVPVVHVVHSSLLILLFVELFLRGDKDVVAFIDVEGLGWRGVMLVRHVDVASLLDVQEVIFVHLVLRALLQLATVRGRRYNAGARSITATA